MKIKHHVTEELNTATLTFNLSRLMPGEQRCSDFGQYKLGTEATYMELEISEHIARIDWIQVRTKQELFALLDELKRIKPCMKLQDSKCYSICLYKDWLLEYGFELDPDEYDLRLSYGGKDGEKEPPSQCDHPATQ